MTRRVTDEQRKRMQDEAQARWNRMIERETARLIREGKTETDLASVFSIANGER